jgi:ferredoxin-NADP reductase
MRSRLEWRTAQVQRIEEMAGEVRLIEFAVEGRLPRFEPGSHLNIRVRIGADRTTRTYTCLPAPAGCLRVAVKRHAHSRGGSRFMWELAEGAEVELTVPENRFELSWRDGPCLLIAGGIGITPIYGMALALAARGTPLRMVYGGRTRAGMAFADELAQRLGERLEVFAGDEGRRIDIAAELTLLPPDGELYVCGPIGMLEAVKAAWAVAKRPVSRLRYEVFGDSGQFAEAPFEVSVAGRNVAVNVRADQTLLEALLGAGVEMIYDCQRGECGLCAVEVLEREAAIDHRDVFFSAEEKHQGKRMCACVSRLAGGKAVIDVGYRG